MKVVVFWLTFCVLLWTSCGDSLNTKDSKGGIYGIVTDYSTAEPMRAAGVSLLKNGNLLLKTVTYDDGHFEFNDLEVGIYELTVEMNGYDSISETVLVESGRIARADIQMTIALTELKVVTLAPRLVWSDNHIDCTWFFYGQILYPRGNNVMYPTDYGFVFGSSSNPTLENCQIVMPYSHSSYNKSACTIDFSNTVGVYTVNLYLGDKDYHVRAFAINTKGVYYGANMVCHHR